MKLIVLMLQNKDLVTHQIMAQPFYLGWTIKLHIFILVKIKNSYHSKQPLQMRLIYITNINIRTKSQSIHCKNAKSKKT